MSAYKRVKGGEKTERTGEKWSKKELTDVFDLYLILEGKKIHENNPQIHNLARTLNRSVRSVESQLLMFRNLSRGGEYSRKNMNKLSIEIWNENMELYEQSSSMKKFKIDDSLRKGYKPESELHYDVSSGLKNLIGQQLITNDLVAVFELVKNSFDARATSVQIIFENLYSNNENSRIIIKDNGKGMSFEDLVNKWLFVGYSAKRDGTEDKEDYRHKTGVRQFYAGAKGVGRFSCDRLGKKLILKTRKNIPNSHVEILETEWERFEENSLAKFEDIGVSHSRGIDTDIDSDSGTTLIIKELRSDWNRAKLLSLKRSLEKLITPINDDSKPNFEIDLVVKEELLIDNKQTEYSKKVNGKVENFVFDLLGVKSTSIEVEVDPTGEFITTKINDRGIDIFEIKESNPFDLLHNVKSKIFYLNKSAKNNFKRKMGITTVQFGSVFLYKNGFRINPYGNPDDDSFDVDKRYLRGQKRHFSRRSIIGRVEVHGANSELEETTSRDGGLISNDTSIQLLDFLHDIVLSRLENYVINVIKWGTKLDNENINDLSEEERRQEIIELVGELINPGTILDIDFNSNIVDLLETREESTALKLFEGLRKAAEESKDSTILDELIKAEERLGELRSITNEALKEESKAKKELRKRNSQNLFLKSLKSQDFDELVSFMHSIGISSDILNNYINGMFKRLNRGENIPKEELIEKLKTMSLENHKILTLSKFGTKASFKLYSEVLRADIVEFIDEYVRNILKPLRGEDILIDSKATNTPSFECEFNPLELTIMIDNFLSNSVRAKSETFIVEYQSEEENLRIDFKDEGKGIDPEVADSLFEMGITTTSGSGIGLYHVKQIIDSADNLSIDVKSNSKKGTIMSLTVLKN